MTNADAARADVANMMMSANRVLARGSACRSVTESGGMWRHVKSIGDA